VGLVAMAPGLAFASNAGSPAQTGDAVRFDFISDALALQVVVVFPPVKHARVAAAHRLQQQSGHPFEGKKKRRVPSALPQSFACSWR
jgi:hypothetical protein